MKRLLFPVLPTLLLGLTVLSPGAAEAQADFETVRLQPIADATIYEEGGDTANGSGSFLFTGRTNNGLERRALLMFDIAGNVPSDATIFGATFSLTLSRTQPTTHFVEVRRVTESWTEGPSNPTDQEGSGAPSAAGDVTWVHRTFPDDMWATPGGSISDTLSTRTLVDSTRTYSFIGEGLTSDVQQWHADPSSNMGWALVIPEAPDGSAKRFNSREHDNVVDWQPQLVITYLRNPNNPVANFSFRPPLPIEGETVSFIDQSAGSPSEWQWDFGDGSSSTEQNPSYAFAAEGIYDVTLTVTNSSGSDSQTIAVTVKSADGPGLSELVLIPSASNASGSGGSFFVTTADVLNGGSSPARYQILWLPRNSDNSDPLASAVFELQPGAVQRFDNLLDDVFGLEGVGAAAVLSDSGDLQVMSRTFNLSDAGTFGQSLPGVTTLELIRAGDRVRVMFLTENADFRSNFGVVNGSTIPITVEWEMFDAAGDSLGTGSVDLAPWGNTQINRILADHAPIEAAYVEVWSMDSGAAFTCHGSVADNATSDPTTVLLR